MSIRNKYHGAHHLITLDGMRGVAAIMVVYLHATIPFFDFRLAPHGALAVDFFFCLSGFVVALAYRDKLLGSMSFSDFLRVRFQRLYPMVFFGNILGCFVVVIHMTVEPHWVDQPMLLPAIFLLSFVLVPSPVGLSPDWPPIFPINPPLWSLFFEMVVNVVYAKVVGLLTPRLMGTLLVILAGVYVSHTAIDGQVGRSIGLDVLTDGLIRVGYPFLIGVYLHSKASSATALRDGRISLVLIFLLALIFVMPTSSHLNPYYESASVVLFFPVLVWLGARTRPTAGLSALYSSLGRLSYPLYAIHAPIIRLGSHLMRSMHLSEAGQVCFAGLEVVLCIIAAVGVLKFFDEPVRKWLSRLWAVQSPAGPGLPSQV